MARPTPVLPLVGSTSVPPGRSSPDCSAASIMRSAIRSLTEPPGLQYSTLASTSCYTPAATEPSRTSGVLPTRSITDSENSMPERLGCARHIYAGTDGILHLSAAAGITREVGRGPRCGGSDRTASVADPDGDR